MTRSELRLLLATYEVVGPLPVKRPANSGEPRRLIGSKQADKTREAAPHNLVERAFFSHATVSRTPVPKSYGRGPISASSGAVS